MTIMLRELGHAAETLAGTGTGVDLTGFSDHLAGQVDQFSQLFEQMQQQHPEDPGKLVPTLLLPVLFQAMAHARASHQ